MKVYQITNNNYLKVDRHPNVYPINIKIKQSENLMEREVSG